MSIFAVASNEYEHSLTEEFRKDNGIFYTDTALAEKMLNYLATKKLIKSTSVILDPCCGTGSFLFAAKALGYINTYGIDIDSNAVKFCREHILETCFVEADFLEQNAGETLVALSLNEKVDCIIGNPPYAPIAGNISLKGDYIFAREVSDSGNNLFVATLLRSLQLLRDGGVLSYIIPKNFLHVTSYSLLRRKILNEYTIISIVDIGQYFKNVRGEQIIFTIRKKSHRKSNKIEVRGHYSNRFNLLCKVQQSFYNDEVLLFVCDEDRKIYEHLTRTYKTLNDYCKGYVGRGKATVTEAIAGGDIRKFGYKRRTIPPDNGQKIFIQNIYSAEAGIIATYGGNLEATQTVTVLTDGDPKMCRFILGVLHSRLCNFFLYRYCYNRSRLTMHVDAKYLRKVPLPSHSDEEFRQDFEKLLPIVAKLEKEEYLTRQWFEDIENLNKVVYEIYGLEADLVAYIEGEMRKAQSKRWFVFE